MGEGVSFLGFFYTTEGVFLDIIINTDYLIEFQVPVIIMMQCPAAAWSCIVYFETGIYNGTRFVFYIHCTFIFRFFLVIRSSSFVVFILTVMGKTLKTRQNPTFVDSFYPAPLQKKYGTKQTPRLIKLVVLVYFSLVITYNWHRQTIKVEHLKTMQCHSELQLKETKHN